MAFKRSWIWALTTAGIVGYFALATYLDRTYVELRPSGKFVLLLNGPFTHEIGPAYWVSQLRPGEGRILANFHSTFHAISKTGRGHFAHWSGRGIYFSSSDNTRTGAVIGQSSPKFTVSDPADIGSLHPRRAVGYRRSD
jgi:hypothetical protein